ncbi:MAG: hypothetical protein CSA33_03800 [Desulfobulbus propionicus]|nr:MAG: hypothetical protein CSA33_03800 [Desulfobulbus propionicus]
MWQCIFYRACVVGCKHASPGLLIGSGGARMGSFWPFIPLGYWVLQRLPKMVPHGLSVGALVVEM